MHIEVLNAKGANDQIISELVPLVEQMLDVPEARPTALRLRDLCNRALERAWAMSATDQLVFPPSLRVHSDPASPPVTPPKLPLRSRRPSEGLRIDGVHLPDSPLSPEYPSDNNRSSYTPRSPVSIDHDKHISIETVMSDNRSISYENGSRGAAHGGARASVSPTTSPTSTSSRYHRPPSSGDWNGQPYTQTSNGIAHMSNEWSISGQQSPTNQDPEGVHKNPSQRTNRESVHSRRTKSIRPYVNIHQVDTWIEKKKAKNVPAPPRPIPEGDLDALDGRDQVSKNAQL
jgi:hypothetical protein